MAKNYTKINDKIIRAAIYIRVSTQDQARNGYSLDAQKERLLEHCKANNYKLIGIYADEGKSARSKLSNRKELLRLIEDVKEDKLDRIVMWRLDRWFRNVADYYQIQKILDENNVDWECSDEEYDTYTSNGRLHLNIKLSIAQNESDQTGDRIRFDFQNMVKNKRPISGSRCLPMGYIVSGKGKDKTIIKDEEYEDIVIDMFDKFEETHSIRKTTVFINEKYNKKILYEVINKCLKNPFYYGTYRGVDDYCPAYISKEKFDELQGYIKKNYKENKKNHDYIFSRLVRCPACGQVMSGHSNRHKQILKSGDEVIYDKQYYRCKNAYLNGGCNYRHSISQNLLEKWLLTNFLCSLEGFIADSDNNEIRTNKAIIKDTSKLKEKLDRLNDLYIEGRISKEKYENDYSKINEEIKKITSIKEESKKEIKVKEYRSLIENGEFAKNFSKLTDRNKQIFLSKYIEYITVDKENKYKIVFR